MHNLAVDVFEDPRSALQRVAPFLAEDPVARNLPATLLPAAIDGGWSIRCWVAHDGPSVVGLALQTDPRRFAMVFADSRGVGLRLGDAVGADAIDLPSARGEVGVVAPFAGAYAAVTGRPAIAGEAQRLYVLDAVRDPDVSGRVRSGTADDEEIVARWAEGFVTDTGFGNPADVSSMLARLAAGLIRVWVDEDAPVSMGLSAPVAYGVSRVGWIYTPPEHRGQGYGAAVTAAISAEQLAGDATRCMLYAQLNNPVSNRIYRRLGYRAVSEDLGYDFD